MSDFVHLHVHSHYSILDGVSKPPEIIAKAKEYNQSAIALTDHGNMFGAMDFYHCAKKASIKPIFGCEFYIAPNSRFDRDPSNKKYYHIVLLAKDLEGYRNLIKLVSIGYLEGFRYKPRIDKEVLAMHSRGLVALTACLAGEIPSLILEENQHGLDSALDWYIDVFGRDNFFLELQNHRLSDELVAGKRIIELSKKTGLKLVATNDAHYAGKEDAILQEIMFATRDRTSLNDPKRFRYENDEFYLKSPSEMEKLFEDIPEAIANTRLVAEMCNFDLAEELKKKHLPNFKLPQGESADSYLRRLSEEGLCERFDGKNPPAEYTERLNSELDIIKNMGFSNYFLVVSDFVKYAKKTGILVGPGRGSAAGALVSYALSITNVDPIRYALFFERFLNPERVSMPDIDIDFEDLRRDEVKEYIRSFYGYDKTADIITFGYLKSRAALTDVGRALDIPLVKVRSVTKLINNAQANTPLNELIYGEEKSETIPELRDIAENGSEEEKRWIEYSCRLDGTIRQVGTHASGLIISGSVLDEIIPLYKDSSNDIISTQFEGKFLEENGLLKMDVLGLATLTLIKDTLSRIKRNHRVDIDLDNIPLDDMHVYKIFWEGKTFGIFQFESPGMTAYLQELKPTCIDDLIAMNALYRPGPMEHIPSFIRRKHGEEEVDCFHPDLEPILHNTYGIIVYQEQVMQIGQKLAGFSLGKADVIRRVMAKKKADELDKIRPEWVEGSVKRGYPKELAEKIFDLLGPFSRYAFNKSHSAAYSILAYQTAYLKAHYPVEFMASILSLNMNDDEKLKKYCSECMEMGIKLNPPDINLSFWDFRDNNGEIMFGFGGIKGLGEGFVDCVVKERELGGNFFSFEDFVNRMIAYPEFKKNSAEILVKAGAFDGLIDQKELLQKKSVLLANVNNFISQIEKNKREKEIGQLGLFGEAENNGFDIHIDEKVKPLTLRDEFKNEIEVFGFYLSKRIFDIQTRKYGAISDYSDCLRYNLKAGTRIFLWGYITEVSFKIGARKSEYAIIELDNGREMFKFFLFDRHNDKKLSQFRPLLVENNFVSVRLEVSENKERGNQYDILEIRSLEHLDKERFKELNLFIENNSHPEELRLGMERFRQVLQRHHGSMRLIIHSTKNGKPDRVFCSNKYALSYSPEILDEVKKLPGLKGAWVF